MTGPNNNFNNLLTIFGIIVISTCFSLNIFPLVLNAQSITDGSNQEVYASKESTTVDLTTPHESTATLSGQDTLPYTLTVTHNPAENSLMYQGTIELPNGCYQLTSNNLYPLYDENIFYQLIFNYSLTYNHSITCTQSIQSVPVIGWAILKSDSVIPNEQFFETYFNEPNNHVIQPHVTHIFEYEYGSVTYDPEKSTLNYKTSVTLDNCSKIVSTKASKNEYGMYNFHIDQATTTQEDVACDTNREVPITIVLKNVQLSEDELMQDNLFSFTRASSLAIED